MNETTIACRRETCGKAIPPRLSDLQLCLDHFLDEAFARTNHAMEQSRDKRPIDALGVQKLLADALVVVEHLDDENQEIRPEQRDRMLELLLILANLHEYVARRPVPINRLS